MGEKLVLRTGAMADPVDQADGEARRDDVHPAMYRMRFGSLDGDQVTLGRLIVDGQRVMVSCAWRRGSGRISLDVEGLRQLDLLISAQGDRARLLLWHGDGSTSLGGVRPDDARAAARVLRRVISVSGEGESPELD